MLTRLKKTRNPEDRNLEHVLKEKSKTKISKKEYKNTQIENSISKKLLLIEPTNFFSNPETKGDNSFMQESKGEESQIKALKEFNNYIEQLKLFSVNFETYKQSDPQAPDSIFPNNWFSTHKNPNFPEGLLIIYPVKAESRRKERNPEIIERLKKDYKDFVDLTNLEKEGEFLESTGCLIFDHNNTKVYCCYSERATPKAVKLLMEALNKYSKSPYELIDFKAFDSKGNTIYHTNCMMAILEKHVIVCLSSIKDENERNKVKNSLEMNRRILEISHKQLENFCANVINVKSVNDETILIASVRARKNFTRRQIEILMKNYKILAVNIPTIENIGGGSGRCMVAELF